MAGGDPGRDVLRDPSRDNVPAKIRTVAYLTYDDHAFYAAFECDDPHPEQIRAPYVDRDNVTDDTDYAGIILDTRHDRRTAIEFYANPRAFSTTRSTTIPPEMKTRRSTCSGIPPAGSTTTAGRSKFEFPFRVFATTRAPIPSGESSSTGIRRATRTTSSFRTAFPAARTVSSATNAISSGSKVSFRGTPDRGALRDGNRTGAPHRRQRSLVTIRESPDPRQRGPGREVAAQRQHRDRRHGEPRLLASGVRRRPDRGQQPFRAVLSREEAVLPGGARPFLDAHSGRLHSHDHFAALGAPGTGKIDSTNYTLLVTEDRGGGSVVVPGPQSSTFVDQDFSSIAAIGRVRKDFGRSYVSFLATDREVEERIQPRLRPDFQWAPNDGDRVKGQFLYSLSQTPIIPSSFPAGREST